MTDVLSALANSNHAHNKNNNTLQKIKRSKGRSQRGRGPGVLLTPFSVIIHIIYIVCMSDYIYNIYVMLSTCKSYAMHEESTRHKLF